MTDEKKALCDSLFKEAAEARLSGRLDDAVRLFKLSLEACSTADIKLLGAINGMLGGVERKVGNLGSAEHYSRIATNLIPRSQLASIGMFHSLWDQEKRFEALEEVVRLVWLRDSEHYRELLSHGFQDDLSPSVKDLADKARSILENYTNLNVTIDGE